MYSGVSTSSFKTVFLEEEFNSIFEFTVVFPGITLQHITNIETQANEEDLEMYLEISNVLSLIAIPDVFVPAETVFLVEEGTLVSAFTSEFSDVLMEYGAKTEFTAAEEHFVEYAAIMPGFLVIEVPHAVTSLETVFTEQQITR